MSNPEPNSQESSKSSDDNATTPEPQFTTMQRLSNLFQAVRQRHGTVLAFAYAYLLFPLLLLLNPFSHMLRSNSLHGSMPLQVPPFYSPEFADFNPLGPSLALAMCVGIIFGSIHCVAWSFHFPSLQEQLAWRISALSIAGLPILISALIMLVGDFGARFEVVTTTGSRFVVVAFFGLYVIARIVLLILPCTTLRALNSTALVEIQWTAFVPHID
jgi:hypothetical protein